MAKKLLKRIARTTGTTTGEAKGIMKNVRGSVRAGDNKTARKTLTGALKGGPAAGVPRSPSRTAKARKSSAKIVKRIDARQTGRANAMTRGKGKKVGLKRQMTTLTGPAAAVTSPRPRTAVRKKSRTKTGRDTYAV